MKLYIEVKKLLKINFIDVWVTEYKKHLFFKKAF